MIVKKDRLILFKNILIFSDAFKILEAIKKPRVKTKNSVGL